MSDEMIDDTMLEYDYGYPFQCLCGAWDIWDDGMECDICGRIYTLKDKSAQQSVQPTGGTVAPAGIDQRPEVDLAGEDD
jgi:hypothetical protein